MSSRDGLRAFLLYVLVISILYGPVVFFGKTLQPPMYQPHGFLSGWPDGYTGRVPVNSFNIDLATPSYFEWPINKLTGDLYKSGDLPLWNPYQGGGAPLAAQYSTRVFFPYQIIEDLSPAWLWDFFILGRLLVAGFFTYLFLRLLSLSFAASFLGGLFYMFSGSFVWFINLEQYANNAMMLPVLMHSLERYLTRSARAGLAYAGAAFGLVVLAGQPETALYVLFLGALYYTFRAFTSFRKDGPYKRLIGLAAVSVIGLMLSSPVILPFIELERNSHHVHRAGGDMGTARLPAMTMLLSVVAPTAHEYEQAPDRVYDTPLAQYTAPDGVTGFFRVLPINGVWDFLGGYTGAVPLYMAVAGFSVLLFREKRHACKSVLLFFLSFGIFMLLKNIGLKPFVWLGALPLFDRVWSQRWAGPVWTFSFAVAGAIGFYIVETGFKRTNGDPPASAGKWTRPGNIRGPFLIALATVSSVFLFLFSFALVKFLKFKPFFVAFGPSLVFGSVLTVVLLVFSAAILTGFSKREGGLIAMVPLALIEAWWAIPRGYDYNSLLLKLIPLMAGLMATLFFYKGRSRATAVSIAVFLAAFIYVDLSASKGFPERRDPFKYPPYVGFIKDRGDNGRVLGGYGVLFPNYASASGIQDIRYINSLQVDTFQHFRAEHLSGAQDVDSSPSLWFTGRPEYRSIGGVFKRRPIEDDLFRHLPYYSFMGVRYIILPKGRELSPPSGAGAHPFNRVYDREVRIYENPEALGRAFISRRVVQTGGYKEAQALIASKGFANGVVAAVEKTAPSWFPGEATGHSAGKVEITDYGANTVMLDVATLSPGLLVLTDTFYPGWKAYVDGVETEIYRVDGLVRGVFVDKGGHHVVFRYLPPSFLWGVLLFSLGICVSAVLVVSNRARGD